jgi:hypothetical protein
LPTAVVDIWFSIAHPPPRWVSKPTAMARLPNSVAPQNFRSAFSYVLAICPRHGMMLSAAPKGDQSMPPIKVRLWLALACLLAIAGCSASGTTSDQDKQNGLYGGVTGGWTHP